jgi:hypothetical protein
VRKNRITLGALGRLWWLSLVAVAASASQAGTLVALAGDRDGQALSHVVITLKPIVSKIWHLSLMYR